MSSPSSSAETEKFVNEKMSIPLEEVGSQENRESMLPSPAVQANNNKRPKLSAAMIIPVWIILSSTVIIYNNYLYNTLNFKFPVFLVTWHLFFAVSSASYQTGTVAMLCVGG